MASKTKGTAEWEKFLSSHKRPTAKEAEKTVDASTLSKSEYFQRYQEEKRGNQYLTALEEAQEKAAARRTGLAADSRYTSAKKAASQSENRETVKNLYLAALERAEEENSRQRAREAKLTGGRSIDSSDEVGRKLRSVFGGVKDSREVQTRRALQSKLGQGANWESRDGAVGNAIESAVAGLAGGYINALGTALKDSERHGLAVDSGRVQKQATGQEWYNRAGTYLQGEADKAQRISEEAYARGSQGLGTAQKLLFDAGVSGLQMLGDLGVASLTGGSSLVPMAVRVFGSGAQEARQDGGSENQQLAYGTMSAAVEVFTEKMFDGLAGIYGKGAADEIVNAFARKVSKTAAGRAFVKYLAEAGGEGLEEIVSGIVQPALKTIYNGKSVGENYGEMDVSELLYEGAVGALLGGIGGAVNIPANYREEFTQAAEKYAEAAEKNGGDSAEARAALQEYKELGFFANLAEKLNAQARERKAKKNAAPTEGTAQTETQATQTQTTQTQAAQTAQGQTKKQQTEPLAALLGEEGYASAERQEEFIRQGGEDAFNRMVVDGFQRGVIESDGSGGIRWKEQEQAAENEPLVKKIRDAIPQLSGAEPVTTVTGSEIPQGGKIVDRLYSFVNAIGNKVNRPGFGDVLFSRGKIKNSMLGHGMGAAKIETFAAVPAVIRSGEQIDYQKNWKGRSYDTYTFAAPVNYRGQRTYLGVIVQKDSASNRYYLHEVIDGQGNIIFKNDDTPAGASDGTSALSGDLDTVASAGGENIVPQADGRVKTREARAPGYYGDMTGEGAKYIDSLARASGVVIERAVLAEGENGYYIDGKAVLAKDAGVEIAKHEVTHHLQQAAPEEYSAYRGYVEQVLREEGSLEDAIREVTERYAGRGQQLAREEALDELAADYAGQLLTDEAKMRRLAGEKPGLARRILESLKEILRKIRAAFGGESEEARQLGEATRLWEDAIRAAGENTGTVESGETRHSYAGEKARTADREKLAQAKEMELQGQDAESIRKETGWFRGADGKWRFEVDDSGMEYRRDGDALMRKRNKNYAEYRELQLRQLEEYGTEKWRESDQKRFEYLHELYKNEPKRLREWVDSGNATLEDIIDHEELFAAYPQLRGVQVKFGELPEGTRGRYDSEENTITISEELRKAPEKTLLHEIQHAIQEIEGFASGSSPFYWAVKDAATGEITKRLRMERRDTFRSLSREEQNKYTRYTELERELKRIWAELEEGTEDADRYVRVEKERDALYLELWGEPWFQKLGTIDRKLGQMDEEYTRLYRNTAGEIEARDTAARKDLTAEQRRERRPDTGNEDTVFAEDAETSSSEEETSEGGKKSIEGTAEAVEEVRRLARQNKRLEKLNEQLRDRLRVEQQAVATDREAVKQQAKEILRSYGSKYDAGKLTEAMLELYDSIANGKLSERAMKARAYELADIIVNHASAQTNPLHDEYSELRQNLRGRRISLDEEHRADLESAGGYNEVRKKNMGRFTLAEDGESVDTVYEELSEKWPELFPDDIYNPADQLVQISDVLDELKAVEGNPYMQEKGVKEFLAGDILERFYGTAQTEGEQARQRKRDQAANEERIRKLKEQHEKELGRIEEKHREENRKRRENQTVSARRKAVLAGTERMAKKLVNPTDKRHIPAELRETARAFVSMMNTESGFEWELQRDGTYKRVKAGSGPYGQTTARTDKARALQAEVRKLEKDGNVSVDPMLQDNLDKIAEMGETKVADMSKEQLDTVWETMRAIEKMAENSDRMLGQSKYGTVSAAANALREENGERKDKKTYRGILQAADDLAELDMMTPETFFHKMGTAGDELFRQMRQSMDRQTVILKEGTDAAVKAIEDSGMSVKAVRALEKETHSFTLESGEELTVTTAQLMELYELAKREQAREHILIGGIKPAGIRGKGAAEISRSRAAKVSMGDVSQMLGKLTEQQKALTDRLQKYMAGALAQHGNEVSRAVYGYDKFTEKDYWPIRVNKAETQSDPAKAAQAKTVVGFGMAKATAPKASNGLELGSFIDTYAKHLSEMATYASWLDTSENLTRVLNFQFLDGEGTRTGETTKTLLEKLYGKGGESYWSKLMTDIAQGTKVGSDGTVMDKLVGNTKAAAVGANLRVIAQQPTAILRAMNMIDPKYFSAKKGGWKKAVQYAPIAQWKDWGYFEMDTGRSVRGLILGPETAVETVREKSMWGAGKMDSLGWNIIWNAAEAETADKHPELGKGTEAFYQAAADRFTEVIYRTQVVDSVLNRSQIMRKGGLNKLATSFMSEPTKTYNMVLRDIYDISRAKGPEARTAAKKQLVRTSAALVLSFAVNAAAQAAMDAARDDDKEKDYWAKFGENYAENFADNFNPFNYVPYAKDIVSVFSGYDVSRMDMDAISDFRDAVVQLGKAVQGEGSKTALSAGLDAACEAVAILGLPLANVKRDALALAETALTEAKQYRLVYELEKQLYDIDYSASRVRWWELLYAASKNNWEDYESIYRDMLAQGLTDEQITSGINGRIKAEYGVSKWEDLPAGVEKCTPPTTNSAYNRKMKAAAKSGVKDIREVFGK